MGHGFHETKQGVRYTISESARRTVLDRLLRELGYKTSADRAKLKLTGKNMVDDLRVMDVYEEVIQAEKKLRDRRGNWAQPFAAPQDANVFVVAQFLRYADAMQFIEDQPLAALASRPQAGKGGQP